MSINTSLSTTEGQLRLEIGDNQAAPNGARPGGANFDAATLQHIYEQEGGAWASPDAQAIGRAAARLFELLAVEWARAPHAEKIGPYAKTTTAVWKFCEQRAKELRQQFGYTSGSGGSADSRGLLPTGTVKAVRNRE